MIENPLNTQSFKYIKTIFNLYIFVWNGGWNRFGKFFEIAIEVKMITIGHVLNNKYNPLSFFLYVKIPISTVICTLLYKLFT